MDSLRELFRIFDLLGVIYTIPGLRCEVQSGKVKFQILVREIRRDRRQTETVVKGWLS